MIPDIYSRQRIGTGWQTISTIYIPPLRDHPNEGGMAGAVISDHGSARALASGTPLILDGGGADGVRGHSVRILPPVPFASIVCH